MIAGLFVFRQWHQRGSSDIRMATLSRNRQQYGLAAI
jgi:hypothetical protein